MNTRRSFFAAAIALASTLALPAAAADFPKGSPKFETRYRTALAEAKKTGKPIIVVFSAAWCAPCQTMKKTVYPSDAVKPLHDKFVWAYLDLDDKDNEIVAQEFKVSTIPHIAFLDKEAKPIAKPAAVLEPEAFAKQLENILKKTGTAAPATAKTGA